MNLPVSILTRYYGDIPRVEAQEALSWIPAGQVASGNLTWGSRSRIMTHLKSQATGIETTQGLDALLTIHSYIESMEKEGRAITQEDVEKARSEGRLPEFLAEVVDGVK